MRVTLAKTAGFCYGVRRAVELSQETVNLGIPCVMLGPVIHNRAEIRRLEALGIGLAESLEVVPEGAAVILRSHGERCF